MMVLIHIFEVFHITHLFTSLFWNVAVFILLDSIYASIRHETCMYVYGYVGDRGQWSSVVSVVTRLWAGRGKRFFFFPKSPDWV